jgi:Recombinase
MTAEGRAKGNREQAKQAIDAHLDVVADVLGMVSRGDTLREIAANLNERGIKTRRGAAWSQVQVKRLVDRVEGKVEGFVVEQLTRVSKRKTQWVPFVSFATYQAAHQGLLRMQRLNPSEKYRVEVLIKNEDRENLLDSHF